jgi:hypothetical protein
MFDSPEPADFYLGRGLDAQYLGTVPDGDPMRIKAWAEFTAREDSTAPFDAYDFGDVVRNLLVDQVVVGTATWPHAYLLSSDTPWAYSFHMGAVYVDRFGYPFAVIFCNRGRRDRPAIKNPVPYPAMLPAPR